MLFVLCGSLLADRLSWANINFRWLLSHVRLIASMALRKQKTKRTKKERQGEERRGGGSREKKEKKNKKRERKTKLSSYSPQGTGPAVATDSTNLCEEIQKMKQRTTASSSL